MGELYWLRRPIAHRGLHDAERGIVENSVSAVKAAMRKGIAVEVDLQRAADNQPVVFHDMTLERLTNESGPVAARDVAEELLRTHQTDLVVEFLPQVPEDLASMVLTTISTYVIVPGPVRPRRRAFRRKLVEGLPFIAYHEGTLEAQLQLEALQFLGIEPPIGMRAGAAESIAALVAAGLGFSIVGGISSETVAPPGAQAYRIDHTDAQFPASALWRRSSAPDPLLEAALQALSGGARAIR